MKKQEPLPLEVTDRANLIEFWKSLGMSPKVLARAQAFVEEKYTAPKLEEESLKRRARKVTKK
jgi:hypothetical protein